MDHLLETMFFVDAPIHGGQSGSPVYLRESGVVIGIATGALNALDGGTDFASAVGYVRPIRHLRRLLQQHNISHSIELPPIT